MAMNIVTLWVISGLTALFVAGLAAIFRRMRSWMLNGTRGRSTLITIALARALMIGRVLGVIGGASLRWKVPPAGGPFES